VGVVSRYTTHQAEVPSSIALPSDPDDQSPDYDVTVVFEWAPGSPPSGMYGPPENYDPGEGDYINIVSSGSIAGADLPESVDEALVNWLYEHWEPPVEYDGPDPDWLRDDDEHPEASFR
jgi:hypothetical protein